MGIWFRLLWSNRFAVAPSRLPMALAISLASGFNSVMRRGSEAIYAKRAAAVTLEQPPLFVLGHWRTGTTHLHELLVKDQRFSYPTTFDCMAPHHFLLTAGFFSRWFNWLLPASRPMDNMPVGFLRPQEDEFALVSLGQGSLYLDWAFPNRNQALDQYLSLKDLDQETRAEWKNQFDWFIRRLTLKDPRRLVLKSPTHTARVAALLDLFPAARFVHIVRHPFVVIPSTVRTWKRMTDAMTLQVRRDRPLEDRIIDVFQLMYRSFEEDRAQIPDSHLYELRYEDLVQNPLAELETVYRELDLGDFQQARPAVAEYLDAIDGYQTNEYHIGDELKEKIRRRCGDYMRRYGY